MPSGIAIKLGPAEQFQPGSAVYRLWPSLGMNENEDNHVVVAYSNSTVDLRLPETTIFKSDSNGDTRNYGGLDGGAEAIGPYRRIIGRFDPEAALANLSSSGYVVLEPEELLDVEPAALLTAQTFGQQKLGLTEQDAKDYALNNWGVFAARFAVESGLCLPPVQSKNHILWH